MQRKQRSRSGTAAGAAVLATAPLCVVLLLAMRPPAALAIQPDTAGSFIGWEGATYMPPQVCP